MVPAVALPVVAADLLLRFPLPSDAVPPVQLLSAGIQLIAGLPWRAAAAPDQVSSGAVSAGGLSLQAADLLPVAFPAGKISCLDCALFRLDF